MRRLGFARTAFVAAMSTTLLVSLADAQGEAGTAPAATTAKPEAKFVVSIRDIDRSYLRNQVTIQGTITSYRPSWRETAPHSFVLKDSTGNLRVAIWPNVWDKIPFRDRLREGEQVTVRVTVAEFRGNLEGHLDSPQLIWLGLARPEGTQPTTSRPPSQSSPSASSQAPPIEWGADITAALENAKKTKKNIVVLFANPDSDNGKFVEEKVFGDARVRSTVAAKYIAVKIDMRTQAELARQLQAFRAGTVGFYKPDGQPRRPHLVPRTADELLAALE